MVGGHRPMHNARDERPFDRGFLQRRIGIIAFT